MLLLVVVFFFYAHSAQTHIGYQYSPPNLAISDYNALTTPTPPIITKQFYSVIAPNDDDDDDDDDDDNNNKAANQHKHLIIGRPSRNYRVIFIRTPSSDNAKVRYTAELAPREERTVIYVLARKQKELEAQDIITQTQREPNKPEVFFIKYKTNAEATAAQQRIQAQYDQLDGVTGEYTSETRVAPLQTAEELINGQATQSIGYEYNKKRAQKTMPVQGHPIVL